MGKHKLKTNETKVRADIQALRAIAVTAVVIYHLFPTQFSGGFVGVDIFFTISGFLIGAHLIKELNDTGKISLGKFYARRAARLLPASLSVLGVTAILGWFIVPLSQKEALFDQILGSALYVQNWVLSAQAVDYLASDNAPSAVQHYWTLSVEEQFYIMLPAGMLLVGLFFKTAKKRFIALSVALTILCMGSLIYSIHLVSTNPDVAYFSTFGRAWEFLAGVVLALINKQIKNTAATWIISLSALGVFVYVFATYNSSTTFPGMGALGPVGATLALLALADKGALQKLGSITAVRTLGDISYAVYLLHWPLIVFAGYLTENLSTQNKITIFMLSVIGGYVSTYFFEHPIRFKKMFLGQRKPLITGTILAAATSIVVATSLGASMLVEKTEQNLRDQARDLAGELDCLGVSQVVNEFNDCESLGSTMIPSPALAKDDGKLHDDCWSANKDKNLNICTLEKKDEPELRVIALGDSHSNMYMPLYEHLAKTHNWHFEVASKAGCNWSKREQVFENKKRQKECGEWKNKVNKHLNESEPYDIIITTGAQFAPGPKPKENESKQQALINSFNEAWKAQIKRGSHIIALQDIPKMRSDVIECLETNPDDAAKACAQDKDKAFEGYDIFKELTENNKNTSLISPRKWMCETDVCSPVIGNVVAYKDDDHLTATFVKSMIPYLAPQIEKIVKQQA